MTDNAKSPILSKNVSSSIGLEPPLRFPGFEGEWEKKILSDVAYYGKSRHTVCKSDYVSTENMLQDFRGICRYTTSEKIAGIEFEKQNLLLANIRPYLKKVWFANFSGAASTDVLVLKATTIVPGFLKHIIANESFISYVMSAVKGSKMPRGDKSHILNYTLGMPCHDEQQKIADFLSLVDERIEKQRQLVEVLKRYKRGLFLLLFDGKQQNNILSQIIEYGKAGGTPTSTNKNYYSGTIPFLSISDMTAQGKFLRNTEKHISELGLKNSTAWLVPANSLIISMYASYGLVSINTIPITTSQAMFSIIPKDETDTEYLYYYLSYLSTTGYYDKMVSTGTQANLNAEKVKNIPIYFPSKEERTKIKVILKTFDEMEDAENRKLETLLDIKSGLLQQMFI